MDSFLEECLAGHKPLIEGVLAVEQGQEDLSSILLAKGVGWKWQDFQSSLYATSLVMLASKSLRTESADLFSWIREGGRGFTVKSAYGLACESMEEVSWEGRRALWRLKMTQGVKVFAWLMAHWKLLTNRRDGGGG